MKVKKHMNMLKQFYILLINNNEYTFNSGKF